MSKMLLCFAVGLSLSALSGFAYAAEQANVSGDWTLTIFMLGTEKVQKCIITQDGDKMNTDCTDSNVPAGQPVIRMKGEGTVKGNEVKWKVPLSIPGSKTYHVWYKGKIEGDVMSGNTEFNSPQGDLIRDKWKAIREKTK